MMSSFNEFLTNLLLEKLINYDDEGLITILLALERIVEEEGVDIHVVQAIQLILSYRKRIAYRQALKILDACLHLFGEIPVELYVCFEELVYIYVDEKEKDVADYLLTTIADFFLKIDLLNISK